MGGPTRVVAPEHRRVVGVGAHDDKGGGLKGEGVVVVLEQGDGLAGHPEGEVAVGLTVDDVHRQGVPFADRVGVEVAEREAGAEHAAQALVDALLADEPLTDGLGQRGVAAAAVEIGAAGDAAG